MCSCLSGSTAVVCTSKSISAVPCNIPTATKTLCATLALVETLTPPRQITGTSLAALQDTDFQALLTLQTLFADWAPPTCLTHVPTAT